jgi:sugar transferase (PEP-CTERM/EpsH1 system associated)
MKILYLCKRIPFPPDRGDCSQVYHQLRHRRETHEVVVGSLAHPGTRENAEKLEQELGVKVIAPDHSPWRQIRGMISAFLHGRPLTLGYFQNPELQKLIDAELAENQFDVVIVFSSSMAQYVQNRGNLPGIMHFCDVDSLKWLSRARESQAPESWFYLREGRTLFLYEREIAATFEAPCFVSENEADIFRKLVHRIKVGILENGVDADYFSALPRRDDGTNIVFVGLMDYPPNVEAVTFFANNVLNEIRGTFPETRFIIVGSNPSKNVLRLAQLPGVEVTGYVTDVRPYLASATVFVAPLETARGVQNKILEAMAAGVPVLTTPDVAKGLPEGASSLVFTAEREDAREFTFSLLNLLENANVRRDRAARAREFIRQNCVWDVKLRALDELLARVTGK